MVDDNAKKDVDDVGNDPKLNDNADMQSPLLAKKFINDGSGMKTTHKVKDKSPKLLVKLRTKMNIGRNSPKKRGPKSKLGEKLSPVVKNNKMQEKVTKMNWSGNKIRTIKDYFEGLSSDPKVLSLKSDGQDAKVEVNVEDKIVEVEVDKKEEVRDKINAFERLMQSSQGDTRKKTPIRRLKRNGGTSARK